MTLLQRIVNFAILALAAVMLFSSMEDFNAVSRMRREVVELVQSIAKGEGLEEVDVPRVANALERFVDKDGRSPKCLLNAYEQLVVKEKIEVRGIWDFIPSGKEFRGVQTCWDYYSLLYHRASVSDNPQKEKAMTILNKLMAATIKDSNERPPICIYFYAFGSELTTKQQLTQILAQDYKDFSVYVEVDASNDNTHMYAKYVSEQQSERKMEVNNQKERQGFMGKFAAAVEQCPENSLVLMLDRDSILISPQSLKSIAQHFAEDSKAEVVAFKSLTKRHENIEDNTPKEGAKSYPVIAFKKTSLPKIKPLIAKAQSKPQFLDYQLQLFSFALLTSNTLQTTLTNTVLLSRNERPNTQQQRLSELLPQWQ